MARVTDLARQAGYNLSELADAVGVSSSVFYMLRSGDRKDMTGATLRETARVLGTSTDYLLGMTDDPRPAQPVAGLSLAESRLVYEVAGAEHEIRELLAIIGELSPEQRAILRNVAEQMARANTPRLIE